jgi:hypothetical protein
MAGTDATDFYEAANELLTAGAQALDTLVALGLDGAPARQYVSAGEPAADCVQLTVHTPGVDQAPTEAGLQMGRQAGRHIMLNHVTLVLTLFRCVPVPDEGIHGITPPSEAEEAAASQQLYADGWALWNHLFNMVGADLLFRKCSGVFPGPLRALPQEGGFGGWFFPFTVVLDGYEETLP